MGHKAISQAGTGIKPKGAPFVGRKIGRREDLPEGRGNGQSENDNPSNRVFHDASLQDEFLILIAVGGKSQEKKRGSPCTPRAHYYLE
jgi:hypothetical protein